MSYSQSAIVYDAIYSFKDYTREALIVHETIMRHKLSAGSSLLDVACGTGKHLYILQNHYTTQGLDLEPGLLAIARERCITFIQGDMVNFDLGVSFDAITCLFSAIGYVRTIARLRAAIQNMAHHLKPGGVLVIEPWFAPEDWHPGSPHATFVDEPGLKVARVTISEMFGSEHEGWFSRNDMHFLIGTSDGIQHFVERHELGLFTPNEYNSAFRAAGLETIHDPEGVTGRGLYIGVRA